MDINAIKARLGSIPKDRIPAHHAIAVLLHQDIPALIKEIERLRKEIHEHRQKDQGHDPKEADRKIVKVGKYQKRIPEGQPGMRCLFRHEET
jgi:hypothetical protein